MLEFKTAKLHKKDIFFRFLIMIAIICSLWKCSEIIKIVPSQGSTTKFILVIIAVKSEVFVLKPLSSLAIQLLASTVA